LVAKILKGILEPIGAVKFIGEVLARIICVLRLPFSRSPRYHQVRREHVDFGAAVF